MQLSMKDVNLGDAISLLEQRRTGSVGPGAKVAQTLRDLFHDGEIAFDPKAKYWGHSWSNLRVLPDVTVHGQFRGQLVHTSIILSHEGMHKSSGTRQTLDEELLCRWYQNEYYRELRMGVKLKTPIQGMSFVQLLPKDDLSRWQGIEQARTNDQLLDDMLVEDELYRSRLSADWIRRKRNDFGGIGNRWATTKGYYIKVLAGERYDVVDAGVLVEILESINQPDDWTALLAAAGGEGVVREALDRSRCLYGASYFKSIERVQARWGANLIVSPSQK